MQHCIAREIALVTSPPRGTVTSWWSTEAILMRHVISRPRASPPRAARAGPSTSGRRRPRPAEEVHPESSSSRARVRRRARRRRERSQTNWHHPVRALNHLHPELVVGRVRAHHPVGRPAYLRCGEGSVSVCRIRGVGGEPTTSNRRASRSVAQRTFASAAARAPPPARS